MIPLFGLQIVAFFLCIRGSSGEYCGCEKAQGKNMGVGRGPIVSYASSRPFSKNTLEYSMNFWSQSQKKRKNMGVGRVWEGLWPREVMQGSCMWLTMGKGVQGRVRRDPETPLAAWNLRVRSAQVVAEEACRYAIAVALIPRMGSRHRSPFPPKG